MWMRAKENYYNKRTGKQLLVEGKQYEMIIRNPRKNECIIKLDNGCRFPLKLDLFEEIV